MKIAPTYVAFALAITITTAANAGGVYVTGPNSCPNESSGGLALHAFRLDVTGMEGTFDTIELVVEADAGSTINQVGAGGTPVSSMSPSDDSGFIDLLTAPVGFGGQGLSSFGVDGTTDTETGFSGTFASLGNNNASLTSYQLAQVVFSGPATGTYRYAFFDDGAEVSSGGGNLFCPEPTSLVLAGLSLIGFAGIRRR